MLWVSCLLWGQVFPSSWWHQGLLFVGTLKCQTEVFCCRWSHEDPTALWGSRGAGWSPPGGGQWHTWFFMPELRAAPSSLGFSLHADQGWAGTGAFLAILLFICKVRTLNPSNQWTVPLGFVSQQKQNIFQLSPCVVAEGKWLQLVVTPPRTALVAMLSTSNSSTSQVDIIRNPKVNNLIISSAQRLVCRRSDSRKSAAQIRAGKMPDFKKGTGRDPEERVLPNPSLVTYFGPSLLQ